MMAKNENITQPNRPVKRSLLLTIVIVAGIFVGTVPSFVASPTESSNVALQPTLQIEVLQASFDTPCNEPTQGTLDCTVRVGQTLKLNAEAVVTPAQLVQLKAAGQAGMPLPDNVSCFPFSPFPPPCTLSGNPSVMMSLSFEPDDSQITDPNRPEIIEFFGIAPAAGLQVLVRVRIDVLPATNDGDDESNSESEADPTTEPCPDAAEKILFERSFSTQGGQGAVTFSPPSAGAGNVLVVPRVRSSSTLGTLSFDHLTLDVKPADSEFEMLPNIATFDFTWEGEFHDPDPSGIDDEFITATSPDEFQVPDHDGNPTDTRIFQGASWQGTFNSARWSFCVSDNSRGGVGLFPESGAPGIMITIHGSNFGSVNTVIFDGANFRMIQPSPSINEAGTEIEVQVPNNWDGAQTVNVLLTDADGNESSVGTFTVLAPQLDSITPNHGTAGTEIVLRGRHFSPVTDFNSVQFRGVQLITTVSQLSVNADGTEIRVDVPNGFATGETVTVRANNGADFSGGHVFTIEQ